MIKKKVIYTLFLLIQILNLSLYGITATSNTTFEFKGEKNIIQKAKKMPMVVSKQNVTKETIKFTTVSNLFSNTADSIKTLPGVVSNGNFSALLYVRGGGGNEVLTVQDNHYFQFPYFWGGRVSIINPKLVDEITFYSGGFPARYGQMMSGVLDVKTINGSTKETVIELDQSLTELNWLAHGPVIQDKMSWLVSARRTYYDVFLNSFLPGSTIVPFYESYTTKWFYKFNQKHSATYSFQQFHDHANIKESEKDRFGATLKANTDIQVQQININSNWNENWSSEASIQVENLDVYFNKYNGAQVRFKQTGNPITGLWEAVYRGKKDHTMRIGGLGWIQHFSQGINIERKPNPEFEIVATTNFIVNGKGKIYYSSAYFEDEWQIQPNKFTLNTGVRADKALNKGLDKMTTFQPRAILYIGDRDKETMTLSTGRYQQLDLRIFDNEIVNLKPQEAVHYNIGYEKKINNWQTRVEVFFKNYNNLTNEKYDESGTITGYDNSQTAQAKGIEVFIQKRESGNYYGSLSYTFSDVSNQNNLYGNYAPDHDQRHTINLVGAYKFNPRWTLITKAVFHTGKPYTEIESASYNEDLQQYIPVLGKHNQSRFPNYTSVDVMARYKKEKLFLKQYDGEIYFGIANILNSKNVLNYKWNGDYSQQESIFDLPRLPVFGMTIKF